MSTWGNRKRPDDNQESIVKRLRKLYQSGHPNRIDTFVTSTVGRNFPDLVVAYMGVNYLFELKTKNYTLSPGQQEFMHIWPGHVALVYSFWGILKEIDFTGPEVVEKKFFNFDQRDEKELKHIFAFNGMRSVRRNIYGILGEVERFIPKSSISIRVETGDDANKIGRLGIHITPDPIDENRDFLASVDGAAFKQVLKYWEEADQTVAWRVISIYLGEVT